MKREKDGPHLRQHRLSEVTPCAADQAEASQVVPSLLDLVPPGVEGCGAAEDMREEFGREAVEHGRWG